MKKTNSLKKLRISRIPMADLNNVTGGGGAIQSRVAGGCQGDNSVHDTLCYFCTWPDQPVEQEPVAPVAGGDR